MRRVKFSVILSITIVCSLVTSCNPFKNKVEGKYTLIGTESIFKSFDFKNDHLVVVEQNYTGITENCEYELTEKNEVVLLNSSYILAINKDGNLQSNQFQGVFTKNDQIKQSSALETAFKVEEETKKEAEQESSKKEDNQKDTFTFSKYQAQIGNDNYDRENTTTVTIVKGKTVTVENDMQNVTYNIVSSNNGTLIIENKEDTTNNPLDRTYSLTFSDNKIEIESLNRDGSWIQKFDYFN